MSRLSFGKGARAALIGLIALPAVSRAAWYDAVSESEQLTAVNSREFDGYQRTRLPDGAFKPETFAFGNGGELQTNVIPGQLVADGTMDDLKFNQIARMLAHPLASQNYVTATDPSRTDLMVMVYWGRTMGGHSFGDVLDWRTADINDFLNASLLGFDEEAHKLGESSSDTVQGQIIRQLHAAIYSDIEVNRYYVILRAYDFQAAWRHHQKRLVWETRFSLSERRHDFQRDLPAMAWSASRYFGQDSYGLTKVPMVREGKVDIGDVQLIDYVTGDSKAQLGNSGALAGEWQGTTKRVSHVVLHVDSSGAATFEIPGHWNALPAHVFVRDSQVTVTVPGWDVKFEGTLSGGKISGSISEYGKRADLTLEKGD